MGDFIIYGPPGSALCEEQLQTTLNTCARLGVPLATEKFEGPTECLTFLGIEVDTKASVLRLPKAKLGRIREALQDWEVKRSCMKQQLQCLIGTLQHACQVVRPGRSFLHWMIEMERVPKRPHHLVWLNTSFRADCTY